MNAFLAAAVAIVLAVGWMFAERLLPGGRAGWPGAQAAEASAGGEAAPRWVVDPNEAGADLPPAGQSTFDRVVTKRDGDRGVYDIPFPFEALIERIEAVAGCAAPDSCTRRVLIPLGRSLQRTAATPDFFGHPRAVVAVDRDGPAREPGGILLKDRLYLGFQEEAGLIEVISYNEDAARFEFQLVKDYRAGATPRVLYANRTVCVACHQNHAPLFSRQQWDETNGNPRVAALLEGANRTHYGIPARIGIAVPNALDDSTDRANLFAATQLLWQAGCGPREPEGSRCRAAALVAALQYRLGGERGYDERPPAFQADLVEVLERNLRAYAPGGLAIADADIPNRDPLGFPSGAQGVAMTHVPAALEPLVARAPREVWPASGTTAARRLVLGVAQFVADSDLRAIDAQLSARARDSGAPGRSIEVPCNVAASRNELRFRCEASEKRPGARLSGRLDLAEDRVGPGTLSLLSIDGDVAVLGVELGQGPRRAASSGLEAAFAPTSGGLTARLPDGRALKRVELRWHDDAEGQAVLTVVDDFEPLRAAVATLADDRSGSSPLASVALSRSRVLAALSAELGLPARTCCEGGARLPSAEVEIDATRGVESSPVGAALAPHCARCHRTSERFPPNFLHGNAERVTAAIAACAPRIFVRLSMWTRPAAARDKTPMPPPARSGRATPGAEAPTPAVIIALKSAVGDLLRAETGRAPNLDAMLVRGYESLPPCLPAGI